MLIQGLMITIAGLLLVSCASKQTTTTSPTTSTLSLAEAAVPVAVPAEKEKAVVAPQAAEKKSPGTILICKAKKSRFHYDWDPNSLNSGSADQNSIRFEFRQASRPAGTQGENLKVGECGWADQALAGEKKSSAQVVFKSLSDEATQNFYKLKTGKVFKFPVRHTKEGLKAAPGAGVSVIR